MIGRFVASSPDFLRKSAAGRREARTGASVRAMPGRLHLSAGTGRNHLSAAIGKTATSTRGEAATVARDRGWL